MVGTGLPANSLLQPLVRGQARSYTEIAASGVEPTQGDKKAGT